MLVPPNTVLVVRGKSNQLQSALEKTIKRELTFLRSQGDLPYSYPTTQDILDEDIASGISDWKPGTKLVNDSRSLTSIQCRA